MREIKFRAWDKDRREMIFNEFTLHPSGFATTFGSEVDWPIMQFTGLHDLHGAEIYEGDVLREGKKKMDVFWNTLGSGGWWFSENHCHVHKVNLNNIEVIGNIYENPELLK